MDDNMIWVTNINEDAAKDSAVQSILRNKHKAGPPQATESHTVEELEAQNIIGLYRPG